MTLWILVAIGIIFLGWLGSAVLEGIADVKARPTAEMEWCHLHGTFRKEHTLNFMGATICPRCYKEAWDKAGK